MIPRLMSAARGAGEDYYTSHEVLRRVGSPGEQAWQWFPWVVVLVILMIITLVRELARVLWRRSLLLTMDKLRMNQENFVMAGNEFTDSEGIESGHWSITWQDGQRERYTSLKLRVDPISGTFFGTGRDTSGDCIVEGHFKLRHDRIAWTQTYRVRGRQIHVEAWGFLLREHDSGPVGHGQYQASDAQGTHGVFVLRPVLVQSIITRIVESIRQHPLAVRGDQRPERAEVPLLAMPAHW